MKISDQHESQYNIYWRITKFDIQIVILCGNMCEEGSGSKICFRGRIERFSDSASSIKTKSMNLYVVIVQIMTK